MNFLWDKVTEWLKELLIGSIMSNLTGLFDNVNRQVAGIADNVGATPQAWNGGVFGMIRNLSDNVILPIAGVILALVATLELIQMIVDRNNMHDMDTFMLAKWVFKTACAVVIVTNTWNIVMAVFDVAQSVVSRASGLVIADTDIRIDSVIVGLEAKLAEMELGALFGLWVQNMFVGFTMWALAICIFIITYGRMIEIYLVTSVAPIPMATMANREWGQMGQNYLRSLLALGFQAFMPYWCAGLRWRATYPRRFGHAWDTRCCCALRCLRQAAWREAYFMRTDGENVWGFAPCPTRNLRFLDFPFWKMNFSIEGMSGKSCKEVRFGIRSHSERPDESQAEADSEPDEAAGHLFFRRGAHRRTAFLFDEKRAARQHGDVSYDLCHDAVFRAWPV